MPPGASGSWVGVGDSDASWGARPETARCSEAARPSRDLRGPGYGAGAEAAGHLHRPAHHTPPPAERQIAAAILSSGSGRTEILLDPQDLGRVRLSLEGNEAGLVVTIQAERSETADLLRRNADLLMQEFRDAGYADLSFSFSDRGEPADHPEPTDDRPRAIAAEAAVAPPPTSPGLRGSALLDLRL